MLNVSDGFREAVVGISRRMLAWAVVEIVSPDISYSPSDGSGAVPWSRPEQLFDREMTATPRYATLEPGRWLLDGSARLIPADKAVSGQVGHVGDVLSGEDGRFEGAVYAELAFSSVSVLQACSLYFSGDPVDGIPVDFRVVILMGDQEIYSRSYTGNQASSVSLIDFTVYDPTAIRVYFTRWSLPRRRVRVLDIIPGLYERWDLSYIVSLDVQMRGNFADLALPYGTANLRIKNTDRRFEPYTRSGLFQSIEERQSIPIYLGPRLADGSTEYAPIGVFYQKSGGWSTGQNDMYIDWSLVDICGLLAERTFVVPDVLPDTLEGWFQCFVSQLGANFAERYHVDPDYAALPVTVNDPAHLANRTCGALIRFACMATGTWPRADQATGYLTAEPLWKQGSKVTLKQLTDYPVKSANDTLATLTFKLYDGTEEGSTVVISGNSTSSSKSLSIDNPFIHSAEAANTAARQILSQYGGIKLEADSRGDPATEIGDVDTIWINDSEAKTGRRMEQSFKISNGVLKQNRNIWLQADGSFLFENRVALTGSGTWTVPEGVTEARLVLVGGGQGGGRGGDGFVHGSGWMAGQDVSAGEGDPGVDGHGGYIWSGVVNLNPGAVYSYSCGAGGAAGSVVGQAGSEGGHTVFGAYSTESGELYSPNFTDLASGSAYGRTGVSSPLSGTGDGGAGGAGGEAGQGYWESYTHTPNGADSSVVNTRYKFVVTKEPGSGKPGKAGAAGAVVIYWDKPEEGGGD